MITITIDGGTTNTRARVWHGEVLVSQAAVGVGVRDTAITGTKQALQQGVRTAVEKACQAANIRQTEISAIVASGMLTSELGLFEIPHLPAPAGVDELAAGMVSALIPEVSQLPVWFIPGVKNSISPVTLDNSEEMDMMRGEETEIIGAVQKLRITQDTVFILPGSHTKFIKTDASRRIQGCLTTLTGELLGAITHNTIIADAVKHSFVSTVDEAMLYRGYTAAERVGLGRACFTLRILDRFTQRSLEEKGSFLLGVLLAGDVSALKHSQAIAVSPGDSVIILGKNPFRDAFASLLGKDDYFAGGIQAVPEQEAQDISGYGALMIAKQRGIVA